MKRTTSAGRRAGLVILSPALFLVLLEVFLRAVGFVHMPALIPMMVWNPIEDQALRAGTGLFVSDVEQLWVPRPDAVPPWIRNGGGQGSEDEERINAEGYRGPLLPRDRAEGVVRIAALGDSSTFGLGVHGAEAWPAMLAFELDSRNVRCEVLNAGVVGFTVRQGIERYMELVRPYRPDVVVAAFGAFNEHVMTRNLPDREKISGRKAYAGSAALRDRVRMEVRILHLVGWVSERIRGLDRDAMRAELKAERKRMRELEPEMGRLDFEGERRVDPESFTQALRELDALVRADGARLVLVSMPRHADKEAEAPVLLLYNDAIVRVGAELGVPVFDFREMVAGNMAMGRTWEQLFVDHFHPSPRGHAMFAKGLVHHVLPLL